MYQSSDGSRDWVVLCTYAMQRNQIYASVPAKRSADILARCAIRIGFRHVRVVRASEYWPSTNKLPVPSANGEPTTDHTETAQDDAPEADGLRERRLT
jgi:hypothetical protein